MGYMMNSTTVRASFVVALLTTAGLLSAVQAADGATANRSAAAPAYSVTLTASTIRPDVGQSVRLTGRVTPAAPGKRVYVQARQAGSGWATIKQTFLTPGSTFKTFVRFYDAGVVGVRIVKPASRKSAQGISRVRNLRVGDLLTPPVIKTNTLPHAVVNTPYSATVETVDGRPGLFAAVGLPAGLAIDSQTGTIAGTPTATGTTEFTVYFRDPDGLTTSKELTITVDSSAAAPVISTTSLPNGEVAAAYSATLTTVGNVAGTWLRTAGNLPAGLALNSATGVISGSPTAVGTSGFTVRFTATNGQTATKSLTIQILQAVPPVISTTSLPAGTQGASYSAQLQTFGNKAGIWARTAGTLPAGLTMTVGGLISGTPTTAGTSNFTVRFTQVGGLTDTQNLSITINANTPPVIATTSLPNGTVSVAYAATLTTVGNQAGTWSITSGSLPAGLALNGNTGQITGTPTTAGTSNFTVLFTSAGGLTDSAFLSIVVQV